MHELSIAMSLVKRLEALCAEEHARGIGRVRLRVGRLSGVDPAALEAVLPFATQGTCCADAVWRLEPVPATILCNACGWTGDPPEGFPCCGQCGALDVCIRGGRELRIEDVTLMEDSDHV